MQRDVISCFARRAEQGLAFPVLDAREVLWREGAFLAGCQHDTVGRSEYRDLVCPSDERGRAGQPQVVAWYGGGGVALGGCPARARARRSSRSSRRSQGVNPGTSSRGTSPVGEDARRIRAHNSPASILATSR